METVLLSLPVLACLVGLGLMLWFMGRGMGARDSDERRIRELLRAEQLRMGSEFDRIDRDRTDTAAVHRDVGS